MSYSENWKTYKLYNPNIEKIIISRDVSLPEEKAFKWIMDIGKLILVGLTDTYNENADE